MMLTTGNPRLVRKRKAHRKSRQGCANCKIRGIKCDEAKPGCKRCDAFNVVCCYGSKFSNESLLAKPSFQVHIETTPRPVQSPSAPLPVSGSRNSLETYQLTARDISLIEKFQRRTVWTLGTGATHHVYAENILPLAFTNPLLMHTILAMAEMHDLAMDHFGSKRSYWLTYHWYRAVSSMRQYLSKPIAPSERDLLWVSANLISISFLAHVEARTPEEAWPLRPTSPADLSWFVICNGQKLIAELTNPMREDSVFHLPATEMCDISNWVSRLGDVETVVKEGSTRWLPEGFETFFGMSSACCMPDANSTNDADDLRFDRENTIYQNRADDTNRNPYYSAVKSAVKLFERELDEENFLMHICFVRTLDAPFRELLIRKDEKAMLLLLYWYAKICDRRLWWLWKQSCTEGMAICRYLERAWTASGEKMGLELLKLARTRLIAASDDNC